MIPQTCVHLDPINRNAFSHHVPINHQAWTASCVFAGLEMTSCHEGNGLGGSTIVKEAEMGLRGFVVSMNVGLLICWFNSFVAVDGVLPFILNPVI